MNEIVGKMEIGGSIQVFLSVNSSGRRDSVIDNCGVVVGMSDKAVQLRFSGGTIWLPKKALPETRHDYDHTTVYSYSLAKWFRPNEYQSRVLWHGANCLEIKFADDGVYEQSFVI